VVAEAEVEDRFQAAALGEKREVRGRHIMLDNPVAAQRIYEQLLEGADFPELARAHSIEARSREQGGDMGFWNETLMVGQVASTLFGLQMGEICEPFADAKGYYHIVRAEEERPVDRESLRRRLRAGMRRDREAERRQAYTDELARKRRMEVVQPTLLRLVQINKTSTHGLPREVPPADADLDLVRYEGGRVTVAKYVAWVEQLAPNHRPVAVDTASMSQFARRTTLDSLLLPEEAERLGLLTDAEAERYAARRREELLIEALRHQVAVQPYTNEETKRQYYETHLERYSSPDIIVYEAILLHTPEEAGHVARQIRNGEDMWQVAQGYSRFHNEWRNYGVFHIHRDEEETKEESMAAVMAAARKAPVGGVGGPFPVRFERGKRIQWDGHMVTRVLEHRPGWADPLEMTTVQRDVERLVVAPVRQQIEMAFDSFLAELRQASQGRIRLHWDRIGAED